MSYEIPQKLSYSEKILFGLTTRQLAYAGAVMPVVVGVLKQPWSTPAKLGISLPFACLACGFMFLKWDEYLKNLWGWYKKKSIYLNETNIKHYLGITEIKNNCAVVNKKKVAILQVSPINFSIRNEDSRDIVIRLFQKFLNSLDFPIQIMMTTDTVDLHNYLLVLSKRANKTSVLTGNKMFLEHFDALKKFLLETIENQKIRNRCFYVVIPEVSGLDVQIKIIEQRLNSMGLKASQIKTKDINNLMFHFFKTNEKDVSFLHNFPDRLHYKKTLSRVVSAFGYPRMVEPGFLDKIVTAEGEFDLAIHIKPYPIEKMMLDLNHNLQKQRADLYTAQNKGILNPSLEIQYADTRKTLEELQKGMDKLFDVSLYIHCKSESQDALELLTKKVESELNSMLIIPKIPKFRMLQGLKSVAPFAVDELKIERNVTTRALSAFFPFTSKFLDIDDTGVWFGLNKTKIPIIKDIFKLSNPNGTILAGSGAGKSYLAKLFISRQLLNGTKVIVIDPQGEYFDLVTAYEGEVIELSRTSKSIINPLDLMGHDYADKRLSLMDLMKVMLGDLSEVQKGFIDKAIGLTYETKGILENDPESWKLEPPILEDLLKSLHKLGDGATELEKTSIRSLINRLEIYATGVFKFLNQHTKINFKKRFICFNINKLPNQVKPVMMFLVLDYVYANMKKDLERKMLVIDEAWALLSRTEEAGYIFEIVKTCRKFNLALLLINQEVEGLLDSQAGKSVLANSSYTFLLKQKPAVISQVRKTFDLSEAEKNHLLSANVGEGLLITEQDHSEIKIIASPQEHKLITTNADEKLEGKKMKEQEDANKEEVKENKTEVKETGVVNATPALEVKTEDIEEPKEFEEKEEIIEEPEIKEETDQEIAPEQISLDLSKPFHDTDNLTIEQKKDLENKGFVEFEAYSPAKQSIRKSFVKLRKNEKPEHMFYIYDTADYLNTIGKNVQIHLEEEKPDITWDYQGVPFAVEVETGLAYLHSWKKLFRKVRRLNQKYGNCWDFFVTDPKFIKKYAKIGSIIAPKR